MTLIVCTGAGHGADTFALVALSDVPLAMRHDEAIVLCLIFIAVFGSLCAPRGPALVRVALRIMVAEVAYAVRYIATRALNWLIP